MTQRYGSVPTIVIGDYVPESTVTKRVHREFCKAHLVVPIRMSGAALVVAMADPHDEATIDRLAELRGSKIHPVGASAEEIEAWITAWYRFLE
jgi:hypothetical protein